MTFRSKQSCNGGSGSITINTTSPIQGGGTGTTFNLTFGITGESAGDLIFYDGAAWDRLPVGTNGHVLTLVAGIPTWAAPVAGSITINSSTLSGTGTGTSFTLNVVYGTGANTALEGTRDAGYMHLTGSLNESANGVKTFSDGIVISTTKAVTGANELSLVAGGLNAPIGLYTTATGPSVGLRLYVYHDTVGLGISDLLGNVSTVGLALAETPSTDIGVGFRNNAGTGWNPALRRFWGAFALSGGNAELLVVGNGSSGACNTKVTGVEYTRITADETAAGYVQQKTGGYWQYVETALEYALINVSGTPVALDNEYAVACDTSGAVGTLSLPSDPTVGRTYFVFDRVGNASANNVTVQRSGADTINGATTFVISTNYGGAVLTYRGSNVWHAYAVAPTTGGGSPYTLPLFLIGPAGVGPGGTSPVYALPSTAYAAAPVAGAVGLILPGTYVDNLSITTKEFSLVAFTQSSSDAATKNPVTITGNLVINPDAAGRKISINNVRFEPAAGNGILITGANGVDVDLSGIASLSADEALLVDNTSASTRVYGKGVNLNSTGKAPLYTQGAAHFTEFRHSVFTGTTSIRASTASKILLQDCYLNDSVYAEGASSIITVRGSTLALGSLIPYRVGNGGLVIADNNNVSSSAAKICELVVGAGSFAYGQHDLSGGVTLSFDSGITVTAFKTLPGITYQVMTASGNIDEYSDYVFLDSLTQITATLPSGANRLPRPITVIAISAPTLGGSHEISVTGGGTINSVAPPVPVPAGFAKTVIPGIGANNWWISSDVGGGGGSTQTTLSLLSGLKMTTSGSTSEAILGGGEWVAADHTGTSAVLRVTGASTDGTNPVRIRLYRYNGSWAYLTNLNGGNNYIDITDGDAEIVVSDDIFSQLADGDVIQLRVTPTSAATQAIIYSAKLVVS